MMHFFDNADALGQRYADTGLKSLASVSKGAQAIAAEAADYSRRSYRAGAATMEKLAAARSLEATCRIQFDYARSAYQDMVEQATRMCELYAELARDAYKPFELPGEPTR